MAQNCFTQLIWVAATMNIPIAFALTPITICWFLEQPFLQIFPCIRTQRLMMFTKMIMTSLSISSVWMEPHCWGGPSSEETTPTDFKRKTPLHYYFTTTQIIIAATLLRIPKAMFLSQPARVQQISPVPQVHCKPNPPAKQMPL